MDVVSSQRKIVRGDSRIKSVGTSSTSPRSARGRPTAMITRSSAKKKTSPQGEMASRRHRTSSGPPRVKKRIIEDYYRIDRNEANDKGVNEVVVLPGLPKYGDDWTRDVHDFFNLIALVPIILLNVMNWDWDMLFNMPKTRTIADAWTGEWQLAFLQVTVLYFLVDLTWVLMVPKCVRSPSTIIQHHIATLLYLVVPYRLPEFYWCMGACMVVEINTWFLIARRVFNKQGFSPWVIDLPPLISIRVKLISIFFYSTWFSIRCVLYPYLLMEFSDIWSRRAAMVGGTRWDLFGVVVPLHSVFCLLNLKWTYDLVMSKMRYWKRLKAGKKGGDEQSKGL